MNQILFVEDNQEYRETFTRALEQVGYEVEAVGDALTAIQLVTLKQYDLIISDLMMDTIDGIQFLTHVKKDNPDIKTIILTAEPSMDTELDALNIYVDKYLVKESRMDVLLKHIEILIQQETVGSKARRAMLVAKEDNVIMDVAGFKVTKDDVEIPLTPKEFSVLRILLENQGTAIGREEMLDELWDVDNEEIETRVIDVHIKSIRRKLKVQRIMSIRGFGYKWDN